MTDIKCQKTLSSYDYFSKKNQIWGRQMLTLNRSKSPVAIILLCLFLTGLNGVVQAKPKIINVEGVNYAVDESVAFNLKSLKGKRVTLFLNSGHQINGYIKAVDDDLVHIEKIQNKEFFDALIKIEDISAIETRFRTMERR